jgi:hypothetical protein
MIDNSFKGSDRLISFSGIITNPRLLNHAPNMGLICHYINGHEHIKQFFWEEGAFSRGCFMLKINTNTN